jgi:hypothetical protein
MKEEVKDSLGRSAFRKVSVLLFVLILVLTVFVQTANAVGLENFQTWFWGYGTMINSVARGDVDGDGQVEIVSGGYFDDGARLNAQLAVWDGASLAFEGVQTWYWTRDTVITSVAVADVDGDAELEIVTGGYYVDDEGYHVQLCVWSGSSLALENVKTWLWTSWTFIWSVAVGDVDSDGKIEIVTGGYYKDGSRYVAQLCVWNGATLALENVRTWYWTDNTGIASVAVGDVDGDGKVEIVTGGWHSGGTGISAAQLCVWTGVSLALESVRTWAWGGSSGISSVAVGYVDLDGKTKIVTGGYIKGATQLCVWNGADLELEKVQTWSAEINSVAVGDVDGDGRAEIVTGGRGFDGSNSFAQLCYWKIKLLWPGITILSLEDATTWCWYGDYISSVAVGDVDGDGFKEIVTGGWYYTMTGREVAQLCVWKVEGAIL